MHAKQDADESAHKCSLICISGIHCLAIGSIIVVPIKSNNSSSVLALRCKQKILLNMQEQSYSGTGMGLSNFCAVALVAGRQ